ncbi:MAG TPA: hypothetical protein DCL21_02605 [Alphaproteobacteria bacterium]|nr:hypothetical protein [Alphaproteobacteria bacterium]
MNNIEKVAIRNIFKINNLLKNGECIRALSNKDPVTDPKIKEMKVAACRELSNMGILGEEIAQDLYRHGFNAVQVISRVNAREMAKNWIQQGITPEVLDGDHGISEYHWHRSPYWTCFVGRKECFFPHLFDELQKLGYQVYSGPEGDDLKIVPFGEHNYRDYPWEIHYESLAEQFAA